MRTEQLDLFATSKRIPKSRVMNPEDVEKMAWCKSLIEFVQTMPRSFWFSELRIKFGREPKNPAWWGMSSHALRKAGFKPLPHVRNAPKELQFRKGGTDRLWERIQNVA